MEYGDGDGAGNSSGTWFDVRVLYMRLSSCPSVNAPQVLSMRYPPRSITTALEVNGARIAPSKEAVLTLRRDRVDKKCTEITFISTKNFRVTGNISFEVWHKDDLLLRGILDHSGTDYLTNVGREHVNSSQLGWNMDCICSIESHGCVLLKGKPNFQPGADPPVMEVCMVGHYCGRPVMLDQSVTLTIRKRNLRRNVSDLNMIPEEDDGGKPSDRQSEEANASMDVADSVRFALVPDIALERLGGSYAAEAEPSSGYAVSDDAELSWFNAGMRIGVGVGLGLSVGVGVGIGVLLRTYQGTSRSFRRGVI